MATEADIPVAVCEIRGEQVVNSVDNISSSKVSLEKKSKDDEFSEHPKVEEIHQNGEESEENGEETSNELQSKSDFNSSLSKEQERSVTTSENHGDGECQSNNLEDAAKLAESSLVQNEDSSQENNIKGLQEEESINATLHGNTIEAEEATIDAQEQSLESCPPIVLSPLEEDSKNTVLQEGTSEYTDKEIIDKVDKHIEVPENLSIGEAHYEINNDAPEISELAAKSNHTIKDGTDTLLLSPKLYDQRVVVAANEETKVDEIQQNAEESNSKEGVASSEVNVGDTLDEEAATDCSYINLAEKLAQVDGSQIEHDEQLGEESERHPLTEASTEGTNDNISEAIDKVKESQLSESTLVREGMEIEHPAESLHVATDSIQVSELCQENNIKGSSEEQNTNANLHGDTIETEEATINEEDEVVDQQKESLESFQPLVSSSPDEGSMNADTQEITRDHMDDIVEEVDKHGEVIESHSTTVSTEDANENSLIKLDGSENKNEDDLGKESEEMPLPLPLAREISDESKFIHENQFQDGDSKKADLCDNDRGMLLETESKTENKEDLLHATSEDSIALDLGEERETTSATEEQNLSTHLQETRDKISDEGTVDAAEAKEDTLENVPTVVSNEKTEDNSFIQVADQKVENEEHLEKENLDVSLIKDNNIEEVVVKDEVKIEDGNAQLFVKDKSTESILLSEKPSDSFEDVKTPDLEATGILHNQIPADNSQGIQKEIDEKTQELQNISTEDSDKGLLTEVNASEMKHDANLEEEMERPSVTEASEEDSIADESTILLKPKSGDECLNEVKMPNDEKSAGYPILEKENLQNAPEDHKTSTSSEGILEENSQSFTSNKELALENVATQISHEHIEDNSVSQVDCSIGVHGELLEKDSPTEETNARESRNIDEPKNGGQDSIKYELGNEENTAEADGKKLIDTLQVKPEDIKHDPGPGISDKEEEQVEKHIEEEILTADTQKSCDQTQERTVDAADEKNDVAINVPNCDNEDKSPAEVDDGSQKPSSEEVSAEKINDDEPTAISEDKVANENTVKANPFEEETSIECSLLKEEVHVESLQVANEHTASSVQDREESHLEEHAPTTDSQGTMDDQRNGKTLHLADPKSRATTPCEDSSKDSPIQVDKITSSPDAPKDDDRDNTLVREVPDIEYPVESSPEAPEEIIAFDSCQDTELSSTEKQIPELEDISSNIITEETTEATGEGIQEAQDFGKSVPQEEDSPEVEDGLQKSSLLEGPESNINEHESKAELLKNEKDMEDTLINEDASIELPHVAADDIKETFFSKVKETNSQHKQILHANPAGLTDDNRIIDQIVFEKDTPAAEVAKEIESADVKATPTEIKEEGGYLNGLQMTTAVNLVAMHQDKSSDLTSEKTPSAEDLDVVGFIPEVSNDKQQESSIAEVSEEHMTTSHGHDTSTESGVPEKNNDQVDEEANSCGDKTDSEKIQVLDDGSIAVQTDETLAETDPESTEVEVQVPHGEKDEVLSLQEAEIDQKHIKETLLSNASEANGEEKIDSNNCEEISAVASQEVSTSIVALDDESTFNSSQEARRETREETEEVHKQESELQVPELIQESSVGQIERDAQLCASDSGIIEEVLPPALEENIIETADRKESNVVEGETNNEDIGQQEQNDKTKSFSDDTKPAEEELEETVANDLVQVSLSEREPCTVKTAAEDDEEIKIDEENIASVCSKAPDMIEARDTDAARLINNSDKIVDATEGPMVNENTSAECILVNERFVTDLETKYDDEAPQTKGTTPLSAEHSNYPGSLIRETPDSNEENKSAYQSNNEVLESITQVQNCDIISEKEEAKIGEENLKAEIISDKAVGEDIFQQEETGCEKETLKGDILSEKEQLLRNKAEDEDIKDQGSCGEVITESHQDDEVNQEQQKDNNKTVEVIKDGNEAEKVLEVSEEANDKVPQDLEDEVKQEQQESSNETVEFIKDGNETEMVVEVSQESNDKVPQDLEEKVLTNEGIEGFLHQEESPNSIEEPMDTGKARELDIASVTDTSDSIKEAVKIAIIPGEESEEHNDKDEIFNSDEVQPKDEENTMLLEEKSEGEAIKPNEDEDKEAYIETKKLDFTSETKGMSECAVSDGAQDVPEYNDNSTNINKFCEEDDPRKSTEFEVSSAIKDIAVTEQASEATTVGAEVQEEKAGTHLGAHVLKETAVESPEVEEVIDKCKELADTSISVEPPVISTPKVRPECTPLEAEQDDAVNFHSLRDISEDLQESSKESFEVSNHDITLERDPEEKIETSERRETKPIENAPVSETHEPETEEQKLGRGNEDVHEEERKINCIPNLLESSSVPETEKVPESSVHQSPVEDTAQHDRKERSQQIDSPPFLQQASSDVKTSEKNLLACVADVKEPEASPLPSNDKHVVLEADDKKNSIPENLGGEKNLSAEYLQGEYEIVKLKPSKVKQEEAECESDEKTDQKREGKPEPKDPTSHKEEMHAENSDEALHENSKTDDEEESHEHKIPELASEAPVMVDLGDADVKVAHKKSHNILSGVGSKVKHSIAKVKKAITGKSSHPKTASPKMATIEKLNE